MAQNDIISIMTPSYLFAHDYVIKWKHFPRYWPFMRGIHRSPRNSPYKGQWRGSFMFSLICTLNKRLSKQSWGWWFETPSRSLWRHCKWLWIKFPISLLRCLQWSAYLKWKVTNLFILDLLTMLSSTKCNICKLQFLKKNAVMVPLHEMCIVRLIAVLYDKAYYLTLSL